MEITIPEAFTPILESDKRFRVCVGGRGSGKSTTVAMLMLVECVRGKKIMCLREFQNSIKESVHSLLSKLIADLDLPGLRSPTTRFRMILVVNLPFWVWRETLNL